MKKSQLREDIRTAINRNSAENGSDTPDWLLTDYLMACLENFDKTVHNRSRWYSHHCHIGGCNHSDTKEDITVGPKAEVASKTNEEDILERLRGYNPPDRTIDEQKQIAIDIQDAIKEIEKLRRESMPKVDAKFENKLCLICNIAPCTSDPDWCDHCKDILKNKDKGGKVK
jgi:hypothetical protein